MYQTNQFRTLQGSWGNCSSIHVSLMDSRVVIVTITVVEKNVPCEIVFYQRDRNVSMKTWRRVLHQDPLSDLSEHPAQLFPVLTRSRVSRLQLGQLYSLSMCSKEDCLRILARYQWNLQMASRYLLRLTQEERPVAGERPPGGAERRTWADSRLALEWMEAQLKRIVLKAGNSKRLKCFFYIFTVFADSFFYLNEFVGVYIFTLY